MAWLSHPFSPLPPWDRDKLSVHHHHIRCHGMQQQRVHYIAQQPPGRPDRIVLAAALALNYHCLLTRACTRSRDNCVMFNIRTMLQPQQQQRDNKYRHTHALANPSGGVAFGMSEYFLRKQQIAFAGFPKPQNAII